MAEWMPCSQLDDGMDVFSDERPAPHAEIFTQADEPHVRFDCVYGTNHGAIQSFSLPAVHGTKVYLGARAPPPPRSKYAKASESYKAVLTDSHSHGISRDAGWLEYDKHSGVKLVNLQGAGLPMFMNGILNKADEIILEPTDNLELGFGGTKKDAVTPTTVRYVAVFDNMPPLVVEQTMPPPPSVPLGKRTLHGAGRPAPKQGRTTELSQPPCFASDDERRICAQALDIGRCGYVEMCMAVFGPQDDGLTRLERLVRIQGAMNSAFEELKGELSSSAEHVEGAGASQDASQSQGASQSQHEQWPYGEATQAINAGLHEMEQSDPQQPMPNRALREYARAKYAEHGYSEQQIRWHMAHRSAGHIVARSCGGGESVANKMWEDVHANHEHGARPVNARAAARAKRF